jgi:hypothetical protein
VILGHDSWAADAPELERDLARRRAAQSAWHAFCGMERSVNAVQAALDDPDTPAAWRDQLRTAALRAGALVEEV